MAMLINNSKRAFLDFLNSGKDLNPGDTITISDDVAEKWAKRYKRELKVIKSEVTQSTEQKQEKPKLILSDNVKSLIKEIKGVGIKSAVAMFEDKGALEEDEQIEILNEIKNK